MILFPSLVKRFGLTDTDPAPQARNPRTGRSQFETAIDFAKVGLGQRREIRRNGPKRYQITCWSGPARRSHSDHGDSRGQA
jgi:hypothetical protein